MLTGAEIRQLVRGRSIEIDPFHEEQLNPNSYDVRLGDEVLKVVSSPHISVTKPYETLRQWWDAEDEMLLTPSNLYLGHTVETTFTPHHIPMFNGKSTCARYGICVHQTGGFGDLGFRGMWTLEMTVVLPVYIYKGMRIGQLCFFKPEGEIETTYLDTGHYIDSRGAVSGKPVAVK